MHSKCWKHGNCLAEMPGVLCSVGEWLCSSGGEQGVRLAAPREGHGAPGGSGGRRLGAELKCEPALPSRCAGERAVTVRCKAESEGLGSAPRSSA